MNLFLRFYFIILIVIFIFIVNTYEQEDDYDQIDEESLEEDSVPDVREEDGGRLKEFVGTNIFGDKGCAKKCFSQEDIALLASRKNFENLIPKDIQKCLLDDQFVEVLMQYFYGANQVILKMTSGNSKTYAQKAFYDTLGGYLNSYLIPVTKLSFYAGSITLKTTLNVYELHKQCKIFLNTNGNGWSPPINDFTDFIINIEPLNIFIKNGDNDNDDKTACNNLILSDERYENDEDMIISLPQLEIEKSGELSNIWLPFKRKHIFNLKSSLSAFTVVRYFVAVTKCYQYQGINQDTYNKKFKDWLEENIEQHLEDDLLYPGLGAVLRVLETLRHHTNNIINHKVNEEKFTLEYHGKGRNKDGRKFSKKLHNKNIWDKFYKSDDTNNKEKDNIPLYDDKDDDDVDVDDSSNEYKNDGITAESKEFIMMALIILIILIILIVCLFFITKYTMRCCSSKHNPQQIDHDNNEPEIGCCCSRILSSCRRNPKLAIYDEEIELKNNSPSIMSLKSGNKNTASKRSAKRFSNKQIDNPNLSNTSYKNVSPTRRKKTLSVTASSRTRNMELNRTHNKDIQMHISNNINNLCSASSSESVTTFAEISNKNKHSEQRRQSALKENTKKQDELEMIVSSLTTYPSSIKKYTGAEPQMSKFRETNNSSGAPTTGL